MFLEWPEEKKYWKSMDTAPKDRPILVMCSAECHDVHCGYSDAYVGPDERRTLCLYHGHAEGLSEYGSGPAIVVWGGSWDDNTHEYQGGYMPDWWFVYKSEFEVAANPVAWYDIQLGNGGNE